MPGLAQMPGCAPLQGLAQTLASARVLGNLSGLQGSWRTPPARPDRRGAMWLAQGTVKQTRLVIVSYHTMELYEGLDGLERQREEEEFDGLGVARGCPPRSWPTSLRAGRTPGSGRNGPKRDTTGYGTLGHPGGRVVVVRY